MGKKAGPFVLALVAGAVAVGAWVVPQSESYSNDGYGLYGNVEVKCGSLASEDRTVDFDDQFEEDAYFADLYTFGEPAIFEGKTASQVCDDALGSARTTAILAAIAAVVLLVVGFARASKSSATNGGQFASSVSISMPPPPPPSAPPMQATPPPPTPIGDALAPPPVSSPPVAYAAPSPATGAPPPPVVIVGEHDGHTVRRSSIAPSAYAVRFGDGTVLTLGAALYIGRDPSAPGVGDTHRVADVSVSKTHLGIIRRDGQIVVEDLHSTNGTMVRGLDGSTRSLAPGGAEVLEVGSVVEFGDQTCVLEVRR